VKANNYFLDFGLLGSKMVPAMLVKYGYMDDAMKMILKKEAPSWGYWVETLGLTTLSETWVLNKDLHDGSLNHVFLGDISAWMMNQLAGINYDSDSPGFKHFKLTPHFVSELDWAKGSYRSVRGLIRSEWKRENGTVKLTVEVPAGCTADLTVNNKTSHIGSGISTFTYKF
jgi:alpha-L-rhamnosidase